MHIPTADTTEIEVLTFEEALRSAAESAEYDVEKWLYAPNFYSEYRYILGTRGKNPLICVGINPSTAKPDDLDNTLKSVQRIADGNGFDSFLMFNVYAQRATRPDDMERQCNLRLHAENMKAFCCPFRSSPRSGPPGVPSSKSGSICPNVWPICSPSAGSMTPSGSAPVPSVRRDIPIIRCT